MVDDIGVYSRRLVVRHHSSEQMDVKEMMMIVDLFSQQNLWHISSLRHLLLVAASHLMVMEEHEVMRGARCMMMMAATCSRRNDAHECFNKELFHLSFSHTATCT
jgi:hypothetical protein